MSHQDLAISFHKTAISIKCNCVKDLLHDELCRAIYSKLYYALYHKYLDQDLKLATSTERSKHLAIKNKIRDEYDAKTHQIYSKMINLRLWADYEPTHHIPPGAKEALMKMDILLLDVSKLINQQNWIKKAI